MNADGKARELTRHIENPQRRDKVFAFLRDTIKGLDAIHSIEEDHLYGDDSYAQKNDGTPVVSPAALEDKQRGRIDRLRELTRGAFDDVAGDDANPNTATVVVAEPEIDKRHRYGYTRLMQAVVDHDIQTVKHCLSLGANRFIADNGGNTPRDKALKLGFPDIVALLD